jgi:hypothetical protein
MNPGVRIKVMKSKVLFNSVELAWFGPPRPSQLNRQFLFCATFNLSTILLFTTPAYFAELDFTSADDFTSFFALLRHRGLETVREVSTFSPTEVCVVS